LKKLRLGVLVDSVNIPAWAWEMFRMIEAEGYAETKLIISNASPRPSGKPSPWLYRAFRWADRRLFKVQPDAFARKDIFSVPGINANELVVTPHQKKFSDWISADDIAKIQTHELDILIRLGFRILKGDVLTVARFGVWSFHHGDNRVNRGGPPCFWEVMLGWHETGSVLQVLNEKLDAGTVLYRSWSRTDPLSVNRNANKVYWKSLHFIPRQLKELSTQGTEQWQQKIAERQDKDFIYQHPVYSPPGNRKMLALLFPFILRNWGRKFNELINKEFWQIYVGKKGQTVTPALTDLISVPSPKGHYYADPVVMERDNKTVIFFEDYNYAQKKAVISAGIWRSNALEDVQVVIQESFHLSYPYIFEGDGKLLMMAEMAEAKKLVAYTCTNWPFGWREEVTLMEDVQGYDPTLVFKDGKYWLFMNRKAHPGASAFDELYLYSNETLKAHSWKAHPKNPIVSDVKSARPAGRIFYEGGKWYRPAQDCAKHYGHRIRLQEIKRWTDDDYEETTASMIEPWNNEIQGTHTYNFSSQIFVLDAFSR
jgi:hypothetical protein